MLTHQDQLLFDAHARRDEGALWNIRALCAEAFDFVVAVGTPSNRRSRSREPAGVACPVGRGGRVRVHLRGGLRVLRVDPQRRKCISDVRGPSSPVPAWASRSSQLDELSRPAAKPGLTERLAQEPPAHVTVPTRRGARPVPAFSLGG